MDEIPLKAVIAANVLRLRTGEGWTKQELSNRLVRLGPSWSRVTVTDVEADRRKVGIDELLLLALIFKTPLVSLLRPFEDDTDTVVKLAGEVCLRPAQMVTLVTYGEAGINDASFTRRLELKARIIELESQQRDAKELLERFQESAVDISVELSNAELELLQLDEETRRSEGEQQV